MCITVLIYIHEVQQMQPDVFTSAEVEEKNKPKNDYTSRRFSSMKRSHQNAILISIVGGWSDKRWSMTGRMWWRGRSRKEGRKEEIKRGGCLRCQVQSLNRAENLAAEMRLCKHDLRWEVKGKQKAKVIVWTRFVFPPLLSSFKLQHLTLYLTLLINWPPLWANP